MSTGVVDPIDTVLESILGVNCPFGEEKKSPSAMTRACDGNLIQSQVSTSSESCNNCAELGLIARSQSREYSYSGSEYMSYVKVSGSCAAVHVSKACASTDLKFAAFKPMRSWKFALTHEII